LTGGDDNRFTVWKRTRVLADAYIHELGERESEVGILFETRTPPGTDPKI
jgi:hypothetical protein